MTWAESELPQRRPIASVPAGPDRDRLDRRRAELAATRSRLIAEGPRLWSATIRQWTACCLDMAAWPMYGANYLFCTAGVRWAVDPVLLSNRLPEVPVRDVRHELAPLQVVLLTHGHSDHVDRVLWRQLAELGCTWVVPGHLLQSFLANSSPPAGRLIVAHPGEQIDVEGLRILPFASHHDEVRPSGRPVSVPETGYRVEVGGIRILLPGDVRTFDPAGLAELGPVDSVFAHLFLGRSAALEEVPPLLEAFVRYYLACSPKRIVLTHLYDLARDAADCWVASHAEQVRERVAALAPAVSVAVPELFKPAALV